MDETAKIQCPCGQENQLVLIGGLWRYDAERHGNSEPCEGRCFNCRALLVDELFSPPEPLPLAEPATEGTGDGPAEPTMANTKAELMLMAEDLGIEVPKGAKKAEILDLIIDAQADEAGDGEDGPEDRE